MNERSDAELVRAAQDGDHLAWELLVGRHVARLGAYLGARIRRVEVVDTLVAETIYAAWRHLAELVDPTTFAAWFRRIGAAQAMKWHKVHKDESLVEPFPTERCQDASEVAEMRRLERALGELSEAHRLALEHRFRGGLDGEELVEALHVEHADQAKRQVGEAFVALALAMRQTEGSAGHA